MEKLEKYLEDVLCGVLAVIIFPFALFVKYMDDYPVITIFVIVLIVVFVGCFI